MKITRKEKKELFKKLTPVIKARLEDLKQNELTYTEITERTGLTLSRVSEIVNGRKEVNEVFIIKLFVGGIMNSKDLLKPPGMTESQKEYLKGLAIHEDTDLRDEVAMLKAVGEDPAAILKDYRTKKYGSKK